MVTSNKQSDKKVVKMAEPNNSAVVPQRTLLGEVNEHITCPLCRGYYIDATTIVECLHSFCRSCIIKHLQVKSYCPVCEMMINSAKPNIKLDKALQDIVYKLVPGLFQKEMERRQQFYSSRPGPAASATPEQRGEDTERIIFSPEDVISFSLEYADITDSESISSLSSDSNEPQPTATTRRYLQCPAVVNINHLKKFLSMKFDIDSTQFAIDILYKRVPLPDYYTLMDIAYIYNWKRNEPMRFFYQIIDYVAIRNRLFDLKRKGPQFPDRKSSPTGTEDTNASSPAPNLNEQGSEISSGTDSPMPEENHSKKTSDTSKPNETLQYNNKDASTVNLSKECPSPSKKNDDEVEKSQFLNSFELTAKSNALNAKSPTKTSPGEATSNAKENEIKPNLVKSDESLKRKLEPGKNLSEFKKVKIELEKTMIPVNEAGNVPSSKNINVSESAHKQTTADKEKCNLTLPTSNAPNSLVTKDIKHPQSPNHKLLTPDNSGQKRPVPTTHTSLSPKRKPDSLSSASSSHTQKIVSPLKLQIPKPDPSITKTTETPKPVTKKMPDLKPSVPPSPSSNKNQPVTKLRMDLLANNCDPTIDRSKILSQVKTSLPVPNTVPPSGDPLKSLFDSCKINIPSSLSITLTDQKLDPRSPPDQTNVDPKKNLVNKNLTSASSTSGHKVPSPPVHNYIEILKLPDTDPKKVNKTESNDKPNVSNKTENNTVIPKPAKPSETSAKGPIPNLKPIADAKLGKHNSAPITFQQTFEQQLLKSEKKSKVSKNKMQVPKLVPATPKSFATNKLNNPNSNKPGNIGVATENKSSAALDLSTPHNIQSQLGPQQTKAFETMQSIANLAKKQNIPSKPLPSVAPASNSFSSISNRPINSGATPLRHPSTGTHGQMKIDKNIPGMTNSPRQETIQKGNQVKQNPNVSASIPSPNYQVTSHNSPSAAQPSPHSQTRSPSTSPKLVIAEEKQANSSSNTISETNMNQSNQITSTQISNVNSNKTETPKASAGLSKSVLKPVRPLMSSSKLTGIRQPITPTMAPNPPITSPTDYRSQSPLITHAQHAILRHQMEMQNAWLKAQRQFDLFKNMTNMAHSPQNDFNKDKQQ